MNDLQTRCEELHAKAIHRGSPVADRHRSVSVMVREVRGEGGRDEDGDESGGGDYEALGGGVRARGGKKERGEEQSVEDLRSMLEYVKREYFSALVISFKMQKLVEGCAISVDSLDLYEKANKQNVEFLRWGEWIRTQIDLASTESVQSSSHNNTLAVGERGGAGAGAGGAGRGKRLSYNGASNQGAYTTGMRGSRTPNGKSGANLNIT